MRASTLGGIDCDLHPALPGTAALLPYLDAYWREQITVRGIDGLDLMCFPPHAGAHGRPDWRGAAGARPGAALDLLRAQALDAFGTETGILNCLYGIEALGNEYLAAALARALNDWIAAEWLDRDSRLRASIIIPTQNPELAVAEIERRAGDARFVQVMVLAMGAMPLGKRLLWPVWAAAERHGLPLAIHAGGIARHATTALGWPSYHLEDYVAAAPAFQAQLLSLVSEGVFGKFPGLTVVLLESGFTWLPAFLWRANKTWRAMRAEVPWVDRPPAELDPRTGAREPAARRRPARAARPGACAGAARRRCHAAVRHRLSALAFRRARRLPRRVSRRPAPPRAGGQSARDLSAARGEAARAASRGGHRMTPDDGLPPPREKRARPRARLIDCDVHHALRSLKDLYPYLSRRWREHLDHYGSRQPVPFGGSAPYPKAAPALARTDAWPPGGGPPGSDLEFLRAQLLDRYDIEYGLLHLLFPQGMDQRNQELGAALCRALNEWVVEHWTRREKRLKAAIMVPGEDPEAAVEEIERWAGHADFVQVAMVTHSIEPLGRRRYWPVYDAAARHDLPVGLHSSGYNGHAVTAAGWPSFYVEEQHAAALSQQSVLVSLIAEGVFELYPLLRVVMIEAGFAWVPSLCWRLDRAWARMRDEVPHLTTAPSAYVRRHVWFTTQPADEPERPEELRRVIDWIGWDRILFASDYPHWDMDNPELLFRFRVSEEERRMVTNGNARAVYGLG